MSVEHMLIRQSNARESFIACCLDHNPGLSRETVERAIPLYLKRKLVKFDAVDGQFHVKTGQVFHRDVIEDFAS